MTALPGFGKTVATRQWVESVDTPTAWISLEVLDGEPAVFWAHFLAVVRTVCPPVDDEPAQLLAERGPEDPLFLDALVAQLTEACPATVVLDGMTDQTDPLVVRGLAHLVERVGDVLHLVITARSRPALRLARWRSAGWLTELGEAELRLSDDEAVAIARMIDPTRTTSEVVAHNRRLDGWPIGLHMALLADHRDALLGSDETHHFAPADRTLADYLVVGVLSGMPPLDREVALKLSVLRWFDPELCRDIAGHDAADVIDRLLRHGTFLSVIEPRTGVMRFHALFRELMELHLSVTDPVRRIDLHRRAAQLLRSRGDLPGAYHHLAAIGETASAREMLLEPALALVVEGDLESLRAQARRLPAVGEVESADLALDLAVIAFYAEGSRAAKRWCDRAETLLETATIPPASREAAALRLRARRCAIALVEADLETAAEHVAACRRLLDDARSVDAFEAQFPVLAARVMLALRREDDVAFWLERARRITGPELVTRVTVPTLHAWAEWLFGDLRTAVRLTDDALAWRREHAPSANHLTFDTLITAGWCRTAVGDLDGAGQLSRVAVEHADALGHAWQHLQAGYLAAQLALLAGAPGDALQIIDDLRAGIPFESCLPYSDRIATIEFEARVADSAAFSADAELASLPATGSRARLLRARYSGSAHEIDALLADREHWVVPDRVQAELLLLTIGEDPSDDALRRLVTSCAASGWVSPFFGLDGATRERLTALPLDDLHPELARCLREGSVPGPTQDPPAHDLALTARERSLLPLLQTHLSYSEMGERLFLSVNTVKSNLQRLYRKLNVHTRRDAVAAARRRGLV